jgi:uncharacterized protein (DUF58 family)
MLAFPSARLATGATLLVLMGFAGLFSTQVALIAVVLALLLLVVAVADLLLALRVVRGKLSVSWELPETITVATEFHGAQVIYNATRLPLRMRLAEDTLPGIRKVYNDQWQTLDAGETKKQNLSIWINERGYRGLGGAGIRVVAGLGLWVLQLRFERDDKVKVYPQIGELAAGDLFAHRRRLWGLGQHRSQRFGRGTEFDQLREYTPDDEYRHINWKATARYGKPIVNQYKVEQARDLVMLIDSGRLMHTEIEGRPRLDRYLDAAMRLAYLAFSQKDRVGLIAFDNEIQRTVRPQRHHSGIAPLTDATFDLLPRFVESDYGRAVSTLRRIAPKRGLAVLFTDLVDSISSSRAVQALRHLSRTHLPVIVVLDDPAIDALATEPACNVDDAFIKGAAEQFITEKQHTLATLQRYGCLIVNTAASSLNTAVLNQYLTIKARNLL